MAASKDWAEVIACSTAVNRLTPVRGLLHELGIKQLCGTPLYIDSQTTVFVVCDNGAIKRSVWILRRIGSIHEAYELGEIDPQKIDGDDNPVDALGKYLTLKPWRRHMGYLLNATQSDDEGA